MSTTPTPAPRDAFDAVSTSFGQGWQRMATLLFTGPGATLSNWMRWGAIILLAGLSAGGGFGTGGRGIGADDAPALNDLGLPEVDAARVFALIVPLVAVGLLLLLVFVYFQSRFRFVFLEGIIAGEPRIGGVFGRTGRAGTRYFGFLLLVTLLQVAAIAVPLALAFPALRRAVENDELGTLFAILAPMFLLVLPLLLLLGLLRWFVHAFATPYMWLRDEGVLAAAASGWRAVGARFGSFALFLVCYLVAAIVAGVAGALAFCCSCVIWIAPAALIALLAIVSLAISPWLFVFTGPVILALGLVIGWIVATITAPVPVFFRSWTLAYLALADPGVARLAMQGPAGSAGPADAAPPPPAPVPPPLPSPPSSPSSPSSPFGSPGPGPTDPGI